MTGAPLFEGAEEQHLPVEVVDRDGRAVVQLRLGTPVTTELVDTLNDLMGDQAVEIPDTTTGKHTAGKHRSRGVVVVVVQ